MADDNNTPPNDPGETRGRRVNDGGSRVGATRINPSTGEPISAQTNILSEIKQSIDTQTTTLERAIKGTGTGDGGSRTGTKAGTQSETDFIALAAANIGNLSGSAEAASASMQNTSTSIGSLNADFKSVGSQVQLLEGFLENNAKSIRAGIEQKRKEIRQSILASTSMENWTELLRGKALTKFTENLNTVQGRLAGLGTSIMDVDSSFRKVTQSFKENLDLARTGMVGALSPFTDIGSQLRGQGDSELATAKTLMDLSNAGNTLIGVFGSSANDFRTFFSDLREQAKEQGLDIGQLKFDEQNYLLATMLQMQRRAGVLNENAESLNYKRARENIDVLKNIALSTGKSLVELIKSNETASKSYEKLAFAGVISSEQAERMAALETNLTSRGFGSAAEFMKEIIKRGGGESDYGLAQLVAESGTAGAFLGDDNYDKLRQITETFMRTDLDANEQMDRILDLMNQFTNAEGLGISGTEAARLLEQSGSFGQLLASMYTEAKALEGSDLAKLDKERREKTGEEAGPLDILNKKALEFTNWIDEIISNNLGGGIGALTIAVAANTAALVINTLALRKAALGTLAGATTSLGAGEGFGDLDKDGKDKTQKRKSGRLSKAKDFLSKVSKGVGKTVARGAMAAAPMAGPAALLAGTGLAAAEVGGILNSLYEMARNQQGSIGTDFYNWYHGDAASATPKLSSSVPSVATPTAPGVPPAPSSSRFSMQEEILKQNSNLESIVTLLSEANKISNEINGKMDNLSSINNSGGVFSGVTEEGTPVMKSSQVFASGLFT